MYKHKMWPALYRSSVCSVTEKKLEYRGNLLFQFDRQFKTGLRIIEYIKEGSYGIIFKVQVLDTMYAMKIFTPNYNMEGLADASLYKLCSDEDIGPRVPLDFFFKIDADSLSCFRNEWNYNYQPTLGFFPASYAILMEYFDDSLYSFLKKQLLIVYPELKNEQQFIDTAEQITNPEEYDMTHEQIKQIETQILEKLQKLKSFGLICLDQKPQNILVKKQKDHTLRVVLTDFDTHFCCKLNNSLCKLKAVPASWLAPTCESMSGQQKNLSKAQIEYIIALLIAQLTKPFKILFQEYIATKATLFTKAYKFLKRLDYIDTEMDYKTKQYMKEIEVEMDTEPSFKVVENQYDWYLGKSPQSYWNFESDSDASSNS
jgi:serine/threonine protein kinase